MPYGQGGTPGNDMTIGNAVGGGTPGSVLFVGAGAVLAQDNANFFFDNANNRLGIGNNAPIFPLDVTGNGRFGDYNVVGTATPVMLSLGGTFANVAGDPTMMKFRIFDNGVTALGFSVSAATLELFTSAGGGKIDLYDGSTLIARILSAGTSFLNKIFPGTDAGAFQATAGLYAGTGVPNNANGNNGDYYFRADGGIGTHIYFKAAGAWAGII